MVGSIDYLCQNGFLTDEHGCCNVDLFVLFSRRVQKKKTGRLSLKSIRSLKA